MHNCMYTMRHNMILFKNCSEKMFFHDASVWLCYEEKLQTNWNKTIKTQVITPFRYYRTAQLGRKTV